MTTHLYPENFAHKVNFDEVRTLLRNFSESIAGCEHVDRMEPTAAFDAVMQSLQQTEEMLRLITRDGHIPNLCTDDCRAALQSIRPAGTFMEEAELRQVADMLDSILDFHCTLIPPHQPENASLEYPRLADIICDAPLMPKTVQAIRSLFDEEGRVADHASRELYDIRTRLRAIEQSISGTIRRIAREAKAAGWIENDVNPTLRDGRLVIPLPPEHKRKVRGIVYDESATGKTVFVEPAEIVEANNLIRELEAEERREVIRILTQVTDRLRPHLSDLLRGTVLTGLLDFIRAKARLARSMRAVLPQVKAEPVICWLKSRHPLLERSLMRQNREVVPLDITLEAPEQRMIVISGPNAGGKSVCLKTVGLLQYMLQCGLLIPVDDGSVCGIFENLCIDIGDEQSIEDDLSTYSSHLTNMKQFVRAASPATLILIDELGSGTEPQIGGSIAQSLLRHFNDSGAFGVITTHFQNLKTFAEESTGITNGAMLYDRHHLQPLFTLEIGRPGSSFAIEIARKIGLPESVIQEATDIVGTDYVNMDKFLQDIVRDKRYWEQKRMRIRQEEKRLEELTERYTQKMESVNRESKQILTEAREEAKQLIRQSGKEIERTIREIKEAEAERERTKEIRAKLAQYESELSEESNTIDLHQKSNEVSRREKNERELEKIMRRRERKRNKQQDVATVEINSGVANPNSEKQIVVQKTFSVGDAVRLAGQKAIGSILELNGNTACIAMGNLKSYVSTDKLIHAEAAKGKHSIAQPVGTGSGAKAIIDQIHEKRLTFKQDLDVRGMRASEALRSVAYFIDDAVQLGFTRVRILHGTGTGALRVAIREYLSGLNTVRHYADEHVQFGGAGITVIDLF